MPRCTCRQCAASAATINRAPSHRVSWTEVRSMPFYYGAGNSWRSVTGSGSRSVFVMAAQSAMPFLATDQRGTSGGEWLRPDVRPQAAAGGRAALYGCVLKAHMRRNGYRGSYGVDAMSFHHRDVGGILLLRT
jgi:hypothetical protein